MSRILRVALLGQPGRFPTVVHDPGEWWPVLASRGYELMRLDLNAAWWRALCSPAGYQLATGDRPLQGWMPSAGYRAATAAGSALATLQDATTFATRRAYVDAIAPIATYIDLLNQREADMSFSFIAGAVPRAVDFADSRSLVDAATRPGSLMRLIDSVLPTDLPRCDLLIATVVSPEDLLSALTTVAVLKRRQRDLHACLADHGFENFSLRPHIESLKRTGALTEIFDTIIVARDERDRAVVALADALMQSPSPRGWLRLADIDSRPPQLSSWTEASTRPANVPPPSETFAPQPVLLTRLSQRRCYWSRCTFCIHNDKYDDWSAPSLGEVEPAVARISAQMGAGYRTFIFTDEALSPALLQRFSERVDAEGLAARGFRWACRSKLELTHTADLFRAMRSAGCHEVLFGVESTSSNTLRLMDKYREGLTRERMHGIVSAVVAADIGVHLNVIAGFPGESPAELADSLLFVQQCGAMPNVTYTINPFVVFPATPTFRDPGRFNLVLEPSCGDMQAIYQYLVVEPDTASWEACNQLLPDALTELRRSLGWSNHDTMPGGRQAMDLYFGSGYSAIFKTLDNNPLAFGMQPALGTVMGAVA